MVIYNYNNNNNHTNIIIIIIIISVYYSKTVLMCNLRCFKCILIHLNILLSILQWNLTLSTEDNVYLYMMCNMKAMYIM